MSECDKEPCKGLIDKFWAAAIDAQETALACRLHCDVWQAALRGFAMLFALWAAVLAQALACAALHLPPWLCRGLTLLSLALLAALLVWAVRMARLRWLVRQHQRLCRRRFSEMLSVRREIAVRCPRECQPEKVEIDCGC
jgi:hypothetical protein